MRTLRTAPRAFGWLVVVFTAQLACGGSDGGTSPPPPPSVTIAKAPVSGDNQSGIRRSGAAQSAFAYS